MHHQEILFNFEFSTGTVDCSLDSKVTIPCQFSIDEQVHRMAKLNSLPSCIIPELKKELAAFILKKTADFEEQTTADIKIAENEAAVADLARAIQQLHAKEVLAHAGANTTSAEELCADIYGQVALSAALDSMLTLEQTASGEMAAAVERRDAELAELAARHGADMDLAVSSRSPDQVNALAAQQFDDSQLVQSRWDSSLLALRQMQRDNFWNWLTGVHERIQLGETDIPRPVTSPSAAPSEVPPPPPPSLEESFTIHLGTQLKQMYNLRLIAADVLQPFSYRGRYDEVDPRRIQTAMDLYSNSLSGLVLLVDNRVNSYTGLKKEFAALVSRATELHFPALDSQLEEIRNTVPEVGRWRAGRRPPANPPAEPPPPPARTADQLRPGDMYLTRHSNLAAVHLAYHIVTDDSLRGDINSRHPVIMALRNVLKVAFLSDVTTLSIPLLLSHEMSEEMTVAWCMKRVELVYKCVKGFMMEMVSWGGSDNRTIHFIVPKNISEEVFSSVSALLPTIFRVSNPLVVRTS